MQERIDKKRVRNNAKPIEIMTRINELRG